MARPHVVVAGRRALARWLGRGEGASAPRLGRLGGGDEGAVIGLTAIVVTAVVIVMLVVVERSSRRMD